GARCGATLPTRPERQRIPALHSCDAHAAPEDERTASARPVSGLAGLDRPGLPVRVPRSVASRALRRMPRGHHAVSSTRAIRTGLPLRGQPRHGARASRAAPHSRFTRRTKTRRPADTCYRDSTAHPSGPALRPAGNGGAPFPHLPVPPYNAVPFTSRWPRGALTPARHTVARKLYIRTFGCQMNEYDSDRMADVLAVSEGLTLTERPDDADVILFNTCSVREKA